MTELRRVLGRFDATCIVIGAIIGVGIFFTLGQVAAIAGSGKVALIAWTVGGFIVQINEKARQYAIFQSRRNEENLLIIPNQATVRGAKPTARRRT